MQLTPHPQLADTPWALDEVPVPRGSQIRGLGVGGPRWESFMQMTTPHSVLHCGFGTLQNSLGKPPGIPSRHTSYYPVIRVNSPKTGFDMTQFRKCLVGKEQPR